MRYISALFFVFLLFATACKKKELDFVVTGNISALNDGKSMKNVEIKAYTSGFGGTNQSLAASTTSDENGNYELIIERTRFEKFEIIINKDNYFESRKTYNFDDLSTAKENVFDYEISPKSWTKFVIRNINSQQATDELKIQKVKGKTNCSECCDNSFFFFHGVIDTTFYCANDGDTYMNFYYWINGNQQHAYDSVYNAAFDTVTYEIIY